jgi:hypothetical protein
LIGGQRLADRRRTARPAVGVPPNTNCAEQDAVASVEKAARSHREEIAPPHYGLNCCGRGDTLVRHLEGLEGERERLEARMRELLDDAWEAS